MTTINYALGTNQTLDQLTAAFAGDFTLFDNLNLLPTASSSYIPVATGGITDSALSTTANALYPQTAFFAGNSFTLVPAGSAITESLSFHFDGIQSTTTALTLGISSGLSSIWVADNVASVYLCGVVSNSTQVFSLSLVSSNHGTTTSNMGEASLIADHWYRIDTLFPKNGPVEASLVDLGVSGTSTPVQVFTWFQSVNNGAVYSDNTVFAFFGASLNGGISKLDDFAVSGTDYQIHGSGSIAAFRTSRGNLSNASSYSIVDTSSNISLSLDRVQDDIRIISSITQSDASTSLTLNVAQISRDFGVLNLLTLSNSTYRLTVADTAANIISNFSSLASNTHIASMQVIDSAAHITDYLAQLTAHVSQISGLVLSISGERFTLDWQQYSSSIDLLNKVGGVYPLTLNGVSAANGIGVIQSSNPHIAALQMNIVDTSSQISAHLADLHTNIANIHSITVSDHHALSITPDQQIADADVLALVALGGQSYNTPSTTYAIATSSIQSIGLSPDGHYLLIKVGGVTSLIGRGESILFTDHTVTTEDLVAQLTPIAVFKSSGGVGGYVLPELYTGPASLGLKYQLIETSDNAVVTGSAESEFIKVASANSIGKAVDGNGGNDVIDGGVGSTFVSGGANHNDTFFLDGRASGVSWSTITDFKAGVDKATIWGFVKGVSSIDASFSNYNNEGAGGYQGLTLHFKNLLPDGQTAGSNPSLNSITLSGHTLAEFGASSLADLNNQINNGSNAHFIVGATNDSLGTHSYLFVN